MSTEQDAVPLSSDQSNTLGALAAALAKAQGAISNASENKMNPHFKSRYADLASIWEACRGPLSSNGLAVMQRVSTDAVGVIITTQLVHSSGEWVKDRCLFPVAQRTPQGIGAAITYGRRYALAALVGVASGEDDDGNGDSASPPPKSDAPMGQTSGRISVAKSQIAKAARKGIIDVEPGETEQQATERAAKTQPGPVEQLKDLGAMYGMTPEEIGRFAVTTLGGKTKIGLADLPTVRERIALTRKPIVGSDTTPADEDVPF